MSQVRWSPVRTIKPFFRLLYRFLELPYYFLINPVEFNNRLNDLEKQYGRIRLLSYPTYFGVNVSNMCNQRCIVCYQDNNKMINKNWLDGKFFGRMGWLKYVGKIDLFANLGEPLTNPNFPEILRVIRNLAPHSNLGIFTNGMNLCGENLNTILECLDTLHISLNAASKDIYNSIIIGGDHDKVMKNLEELSHKKPEALYIEMSMVLIKSNVDDIKPMIDLVAKLGFHRVVVAYCNFFLLPNTVGKEESAKSIVDIQDLYEYAEEQRVVLHFPQGKVPSNPCYAPWSTAYIFNDVIGRPTLGICCPCMGLNTYIKPSIYTNFKRAWNCERIQNIRKTTNVPREQQNNLCFVCKQLDASDPEWKDKLQVIIANRDGYFFPEDDIPQAFEYEVIG